MTAVRERMLVATEELLRRQGYHGTGLNQVLAEAAAPRGSMYHHFPGGKEELAVAALVRAGREAAGAIADAFAAAASPVAAMDAVVAWLADQLVGSDYAFGCPIATVALEATQDSAPLRDACERAYRSWLDAVAAGLTGFGGGSAAEDDALLFLSAVEGALLLARTRRDPKPLDLLRARLPSLVTPV